MGESKYYPVAASEAQMFEIKSGHKKDSVTEPGLGAQKSQYSRKKKSW